MPVEQMPLPGISPADLPLGQDDPVCDCANCGTEHALADSREHEGQQFCNDCGHCPSCDRVFSADDSMHHNGVTYCNDCVYTCDSCDETTTDEDDLASAWTSERRRDTRCVCSDCRWTCADCDNVFTNDAEQGHNASDQHICLRCAENYTTCEECSSTISPDDGCFDAENERTLCRDCFRGRSSARDETLIHPYTYKPSAHFHYASGQSADMSPLMLGWEIEVDRVRSSADRSEDIDNAGLADHETIYCKEDGSLDNGFEMVSHPGTWEFWRTFDWTFAKNLATAGYRSYDHSNTGMHVHVSKSFLNEAERYKLLLFVRSNERLIFILSRRRNLDAMNAYAAVDRGSKSSLMRKVRKGAEGRYEAVNLLPKKTVEFRFFRGTLKRESIIRNLALVTAICHFVKYTSPGMVSARDFLAYVKTYGATIIGEPEAADLVKWVKTAVDTETCEADPKF